MVKKTSTVKFKSAYSQEDDDDQIVDTFQREDCDERDFHDDGGISRKRNRKGKKGQEEADKARQ